MNPPAHVCRVRRCHPTAWLKHKRQALPGQQSTALHAPPRWSACTCPATPTCAVHDGPLAVHLNALHVMAAVPKHDIRAAINQVVCQSLDAGRGAPAPVGAPAAAGRGCPNGCQWLGLCRQAGANSCCCCLAPDTRVASGPSKQLCAPAPACRHLTSAQTPSAGQLRHPPVPTPAAASGRARHSSRGRCN